MDKDNNNYNNSNSNFNKTLTRAETAFFAKKHKNMFSWTGEQPLNFLNLPSPKISNRIDLNDSYEKINEVITNYYGKCKEKKPSISKNADLIKRIKNRFEKGGKILDEKDDNNFNFNFNSNFNGIKFNKTSSTGSFKDFKDKGSIIDNWNKFDKKNNLNSDILRLELMNLNCYSQKDINSIKGIDKFGIENKNNNKKRRTMSLFTDLDNL